MKTAATDTSTPAWDRRRLMLALAGTVTVATVLLVGLGIVLAQVIGALLGNDTEAEAATGQTRYSHTARGAGQRDAIAAAPMLKVPPGAENPAAAAAVSATSVRIPPGDVFGPAGVLTGFPRTPEGAIGQLARIETQVLGAMNPEVAGEVHRSWVLPGGPAPERWALAVAVERFLAASGMGEAKAPGVMVTVEPDAALVKGTDGPDWVTACVLMKITVRHSETHRIAFGHCERMQWVGGRWMVAPGAPPTAAPSTWPGSELANKAGWRRWIDTAPIATETETHS